MPNGYPSRRPSTRFAQLERCEICSRLRDNRELRESLAHPGRLACNDHPEEFVMGHREYVREGIQTIIPDGEIIVREEPIGLPIDGYELGAAVAPTFILREDGYPMAREGQPYTTFLREEAVTA